jgi:hypothetical protein
MTDYDPLILRGKSAMPLFETRKIGRLEKLGQDHPSVVRGAGAACRSASSKERTYCPAVLLQTMPRLIAQ